MSRAADRYQTGAPFTVLAKDVTTVTQAALRRAGAQGDQIGALGHVMVATRVFGQPYETPCDAPIHGLFSVLTVLAPFDWELTPELPDPAPLPMIVAVLDGHQVETLMRCVIACWIPAGIPVIAGAPFPISAGRSPESLRMEFSELIPTYSAGYRRACLGRALAGVRSRVDG